MSELLQEHHLHTFSKNPTAEESISENIFLQYYAAFSSLCSQANPRSQQQKAFVNYLDLVSPKKVLQEN